MNKQRYLAELQRLLVFMTPEDRAEIVRRYAELFDAAGPEGEAELVAQLGSPTKTAIRLSRGYEAGKLPDVLPGAPETPAPEKPALTQTQEDPWGDLPTFDLPAYIDELPSEDGDDRPGGEEVPDAAFTMPDLPGTGGPEGEAPGVTVERSIPLGLGIPLFVLVFCALGVPLGAVCLAVMLALLVPGCALLFGAYLIGVGGLWCVGYVADAILLFGAAAIALALGLMLLYAGFWLGVRLFRLYGRGVGWVAGELLGRRVRS